MRLQSITLALVGALLVGPAAQAQSDFPSRPVRIIVPYVPGGVVDVDRQARCAISWPSAGSRRWWWRTARAARPSRAATWLPPRRRTATRCCWPRPHPWSIPSLQPNLPYDTLRDFTGVSMVVAQSVALLAHPSVAANNLRELVEEAKRRREPFGYGSSGTGGISHLIGELLAAHGRDQALAHPVHRRGQGDDRPGSPATSRWSSTPGCRRVSSWISGS